MTNGPPQERGYGSGRNEITRLMGEAAEERRALPWVAVEKEYSFETEDGPKTLAELFDGRSQLLIYNLMFGPGYTGACPGCSGLADHFDGGIAHLNARDVTMTAISRAPLEKILAYKRRMGWSFPWVSSHGSDYPYDYGFALTDEQIHESPRWQEMIGDPPEFLREWSESVGTDLEDGLAEGPGWIVFALQDGAVYHTYSRHAPDGELLDALLPAAARPDPPGPCGRAAGRPPRRVRRRVSSLTLTPRREDPGFRSLLTATRGQAPLVVALVGAAGLCWWWTSERMAGMYTGPSTELGSLGWFTGVWAVMMAAMMLPSLAPTAALYASGRAPGAVPYASRRRRPRR